MVGGHNVLAFVFHVTNRTYFFIHFCPQIRVLYTADSPADGSIPASKRFTTLKYYILEMLLNCLETETSSFNLRYLLHLIEVYVFEDVAFCPGLVGVVVKTIQEKVTKLELAIFNCASVLSKNISQRSHHCAYLPLYY